jgi:Domain of unknown function (DUF389)
VLSIQQWPPVALACTLTMLCSCGYRPNLHLMQLCAENLSPHAVHEPFTLCAQHAMAWHIAMPWHIAQPAYIRNQLHNNVQSGVVALPWIAEPDGWPTYEMSARGGKLTLLTGVVIGIFSGGGVALSVVSDNSASLVGVAISASLLPPLVNAGMAWAVAATHASIKCDPTILDSHIQ